MANYKKVVAFAMALSVLMGNVPFDAIAGVGVKGSNVGIGTNNEITLNAEIKLEPYEKIVVNGSVKSAPIYENKYTVSNTDDDTMYTLADDAIGVYGKSNTQVKITFNDEYFYNDLVDKVVLYDCKSGKELEISNMESKGVSVDFSSDFNGKINYIVIPLNLLDEDMCTTSDSHLKAIFTLKGEEVVCDIDLNSSTHSVEYEGTKYDCYWTDRKPMMRSNADNSNDFINNGSTLGDIKSSTKINGVTWYNGDHRLINKVVSSDASEDSKYSYAINSDGKKVQFLSKNATLDSGTALFWFGERVLLSENNHSFLVDGLTFKGVSNSYSVMKSNILNSVKDFKVNGVSYDNVGSCSLIDMSSCNYSYKYTTNSSEYTNFFFRTNKLDIGKPYNISFKVKDKLGIWGVARNEDATFDDDTLRFNVGIDSVSPDTSKIALDTDKTIVVDNVIYGDIKLKGSFSDNESGIQKVFIKDRMGKVVNTIKVNFTDSSVELWEGNDDSSEGPILSSRYTLEIVDGKLVPVAVAEKGSLKSKVGFSEGNWSDAFDKVLANFCNDFSFETGHTIEVYDNVNNTSTLKVSDILKDRNCSWRSDKIDIEWGNIGDKDGWLKKNSNVTFTVNANAQGDHPTEGNNKEDGITSVIFFNSDKKMDAKDIISKDTNGVLSGVIGEYICNKNMDYILEVKEDDLGGYNSDNEGYTFSIKGLSNSSTPMLHNGTNYLYAVAVIYGSDNKGCYSDVIDLSFKYDDIAPDMSGISTVIKGSKYIKDKNLYVSDSVTIKGMVKDKGSENGTGSGVNHIVISKDDKEVNILNGGSVEYEVNKENMSGKYSLQASDNAGNVSKLDISKLTNAENIIIDKTAPKLDISHKIEGKSKVKNNKIYINGSISFKGKVTDSSSGLKYIEILKDGRAVYKSKDGKVDFSIDSDKDTGKYTLVAYDNVNNKIELDLAKSSKGVAIIEIDKTSPYNLTAEYVKPINEKEGYVYFREPIKVKLSAKDNGVGVSTYTLGDKSNKTGIFTVSKDSTLKVKVADELGNETASYKLSTLMKWKGNNIVIDNTKPKISVSRPKGESKRKKNWYGNDVTYTINISDNKGIDSCTVKINGTVVDSSFFVVPNVKKTVLRVNTSLVKPNKDGSYHIEVYVVDNAKLSSTWEDTIYIDKSTTSISDFVLAGDVSRSGKSIGGSDAKYKFFFNGKGTATIKAVEPKISSGTHSIWVKVGSREWKEYITNGGNSVKINIPANFKGTIQAYAENNVYHKSKVKMPDAIMSESQLKFKEKMHLSLVLPDTNYKDSNGNPLYNKEFTASINSDNNWAGLKEIQWGIGDRTLGVISDFSKAKSWDKNLPLSYNSPVRMGDNENTQELWVVAKDNADYSVRVSKVFSIDTDIPDVSVTYNKTTESNYYTSNRIATIRVSERNFSKKNFEVVGESGTLGKWEYRNSAWYNTITFDSDGVYNFSLNVTDDAGNKSNVYTSGEFTIDKTAPNISVVWDNNEYQNGNYYSKGRKATITVTEHNFDESLITIQGEKNVKWHSNGDIHTCEISYGKGSHELVISGSDIAGNKLNTYSSGKFIIDTATPELEIVGVSNGVSYKGDVSIGVNVSDDYLDTFKTEVKLYGKRHNAISLTGIYNGKTGTFDFSEFKKDEDTDDIYTLEVDVFDKAGNSISEKVVFSVNRFGSKYSFYNEDMLGNYLNKAEDVKISEVNVDKLDKDKIKFIITRDGEQLSISESSVTITEKEVKGKYVYEYKIDKSVFSGDGKYSIQVYSSISDGTEYTSAAEQYDFIVDGSKPDVVVSGIDNKGSYQAYSKKVVLDIRDISGVDNLIVKLNNEEVSLSENEDGTYSFEIGESRDLQSVEIFIKDKAGNSSVTELDNILVTSSWWTYLINQLWFKIVLGAVGLGVILLIVLLIRNHVIDRRAEKKLADLRDSYNSAKK